MEIKAEKIVTCVLTGGPGVGKSTTLSLLEQRGFHIIPEAARQLLAEEHAKKGGGITPKSNLAAFQDLVWRRQVLLEQQLQPGINFLDRGFPDMITYCRLGNVAPPQRLSQLAKKTRYDRVFLLELLPDHQNDEARWEGFETARTIHTEIEKVYREFGYEPISIPPVSPEERIKLILSNL